MTNSNSNPSDMADFRERRERLRISQRKLAVMVGCSLPTLQNIETGITRRGITREKIDRELTRLEEAA